MHRQRTSFGILALRAVASRSVPSESVFDARFISKLSRKLEEPFEAVFETIRFNHEVDFTRSSVRLYVRVRYCLYAFSSASALLENEMTNIIAVIQIVAVLTAAVLVSICLISATRIRAE